MYLVCIVQHSNYNIFFNSFTLITHIIIQVIGSFLINKSPLFENYVLSSIETFEWK